MSQVLLNQLIFYFMQHDNLRDNGTVWTSFPPEASEGFLEQAEYGREHPSRKAVETFLKRISGTVEAKPKRGRTKKTETENEAPVSPSRLTLLDIPCGSGVEKPMLSGICDYVGMDKTANLVEAIQRKFPGVDARLGDIRAIPCEDNSFDVVYARAIFEHLCDMKDVEIAMKECLRVAKKYAIFSFYLPLVDQTQIKWNGAYFENVYSEKEVVDVVERLGASKIEREFVDVSGTSFVDSYHIFYLTK